MLLLGRVQVPCNSLVVRGCYVVPWQSAGTEQLYCCSDADMSSCGWVQESSNLLLTEVAPYTALPVGSVVAEGLANKCHRKAQVLS